ESRAGSPYSSRTLFADDSPTRISTPRRRLSQRPWAAAGCADSTPSAIDSTSARQAKRRFPKPEPKPTPKPTGPRPPVSGSRHLLQHFRHPHGDRFVVGDLEEGNLLFDLHRDECSPGERKAGLPPHLADEVTGLEMS